MKNRLLIGRKWLLPALFLFIAGSVMGVLNVFGGWEWEVLSIPKENNTFIDLSDRNFTNEVALSMVLIGLIALSFMKAKNEDEYVYQNRLNSWQWSVLINYSLLFVANWVFYGGDFFSVMLFSMVSIPLIFLIRFHFILYKLQAHAE